MNFRGGVRASVLLSLTLAYARAGTGTADVCFFASDAFQARASEGCRPDPLDLGQLNDITIAEQVLNVPKARLQLVGCTRTLFSIATSPGATATRQSYRIYYPVLNQDRANYVAALIHELGHVYQLETTGSPHQLLEKYQNQWIQIELGADFLVGLVAGHYLRGASPEIFASNMQLIGLYREDPVGAHGTPTQREIAFRSGFFKPTEALHSAISEAYQDYDDDVFPTINTTTR